MIIHIPDNGETGNVRVGVNGEYIEIPRGVDYEVDDKYAEVISRSLKAKEELKKPKAKLIPKYEFRPIALGDIEEQYKESGLTVHNAVIGRKFKDVISIRKLTGHVVYTTAVKAGDALVTTNAHTLASDYVPYMYVFDGESTLVDIVTYDHLNNAKKYIFEDNGFIYMCFDYMAVQAGEFFYIQHPTDNAPLVLYAENAEEYLTDASVGDAVIQAIMDSRTIYIRVPNADGKKYTAVYSPILMHQLPNYMNEYVYLVFLNDGVNQATGMPTINQLKILTSHKYNMTPLI